MTQPPSLPPDPDMLASAIVDGLLPPAEADTARRDPAVAQRIDEILRVRAAVRATPPPPSPAAVDHAVAAALAMFDSSSAAADREQPHPLRVVARPPGSPSPGGPVAVPHRRRSVPPTWLAAAAVILVVVGLALAGMVNRGGDDEDRATAGSEAADSTGAASAGDGAGDDEARDAPAATEADSFSESEEGQAADAGPSEILVPQLGPVADDDQLAREVQANLAPGRTAASRAVDADADLSAPGPPDVAVTEACPGLSYTGDPARGPQTFVAEAEIDGRFVVVHLYEDESGVQLVATDDSCTDVVDVPYQG